ncbi:hypothetical protein CAEBREN_10088 [Caenorhabditis brenneri]|uniref:Uncharacterized protein n=1 Tax=Caenorhabditis brenneri TaxID=135651 RepID=G0NPG0_CAEBE|nr:hypothetical protein CAEBREN_10088 [Caenorhabditis brenneri]
MLSAIQRPFKKRMMLRAMSKGYPETFEPYVPQLFTQAKSADSIESKTTMLKIFYAGESLDLVNKRSLDMIREKMLDVFTEIDEIRKVVREMTFPANVVAVSFSMHGFKIGGSCTDFVPFSKGHKDAVLTYQQISANAQATYYHDGGNAFLAGICMYPVPHGWPKFFDLEWELIYLTWLRGEPFPLGERKAGINFIENKAYGRFCETAGRRVIVDFNNWTRHREFNFKTLDYKYVECPECAWDFREYKRSSRRAKQEQNLRPIRRHVAGTVWARSSAEARELEGSSEDELDVPTEDLEDPSKEVAIPVFPSEDPEDLPGELVIDMLFKSFQVSSGVVEMKSFGKCLKEKKKAGATGGEEPCSSNYKVTSM